MSKGKLGFNQTAIEYYTPKYLVDMFGKFDYDPATTAETEEWMTYEDLLEQFCEGERR